MQRHRQRALFLFLFHAISALTSADPVRHVAARAAATVVTVAAAIPSREPSYKDEGSLKEAVLNSTNFYRDEHSVDPLAWNDTLADFAADYLRDMDGCAFEHSGGPYGENLAMGYPNAAAAVEGWGEERDRYDFDKAEFGHDTGHFTQLVWKNTTAVGCGTKLCGRRGWFLVCEYWPRGNVVGFFKDQVRPQVKGEGSAASANLALPMLSMFALLLLELYVVLCGD